MIRNSVSLLRVILLCGFLPMLNLNAATPMFDESSFSQIKFLQGRWKGVGPDGKDFFDEYVMVGPTLLRSVRYSDGTFQVAVDESTVALKNGVVISTWGQFTWRAISLSSSKACFEPIEAPSSFCWEQVETDKVAVTQKWTDADGKEQSYILTLNRVKPLH